MLVRLAAIGAVLLVVAGSFAAVAGWLSPHRLIRDRILTVLQGPNPPEPGFRRNHAKGMCVTGWFDSNGNGAEISRASVFRPGKVPLVGRFAFSGYMPFQADKPDAVRSLALRFLPADGGEWRTGMINIPVFLANSAQGFIDLLTAAAPTATGKPDPAKMQAFAAVHPETMRAFGLLKQAPVTAGFGDATYHGLDAFRFTNAGGVTVPVRWSVVPLQPATPKSSPPPNASANYMFDAVAAQIHAHPLQWRLAVTVAGPGDPTADPTLPWPADRRQIDAGIITLDQVSSEDGGRCTDVNYDPLVLPAGMAPSDDPIPSARSASYARSFTLRAGERAEKPPSAVTRKDVQAAGGDKS